MNHSRYGYSAVSTFNQCQFRYFMQYIKGVDTIPSDDPQNALIIGSALHMGIETGVNTAVQWYFEQYPVITDNHINEAIKLQYLIELVKQDIPATAKHETLIRDKYFIGTADLLIPFADGTYDLYDFKYSNNVLTYLESSQLHLYKYYLEKTTDIKINRMGFVFVPKLNIRQKKSETEQTFRTRLYNELKNVKLRYEYVEYDPNMIIKHLETCQHIDHTKAFKKHQTRLCDWCNYKLSCIEGKEFEMLPTTDRVPVSGTSRKKIWIYGAPFSGKTTLADGAPTPLNLNTDGNVKFLTMPRLAIKDTYEGRQKRLAWEVFKSAVDELESGSDFETIVVDLLEDVYESCRLYKYRELNIEHESDNSFKAWDAVRTEFLSTIRRLLNLDYNIILISHEDTTKDITKRNGDKVTAIKPNLSDKVAVKIAGMVDVVIRAEKDNDEYTINTKTSNVVFGGGRLTGLKAVEMPNSWNSIEQIYNEFVDSNAPEQTTNNTIVPDAEPTPVEVVPAEPVETPPTREDVETPRRTRRRRERKDA